MKKLSISLVLLIGLFTTVSAQSFKGSISGIESKQPFTVPKIQVPVFATKTYNVKDFGAKGDSTTNDTPAINKAIEKCNAEGGGSIIFPAGRYIAASIHLKSNVCFKLDEKAEIYGAASGYDAPEPHEPYEKYQDYGHSHFHNSLMWGEDIENFAIIGGKVTGGPIIQGDPKGKDIGDKVIVIVRGKNLLFRNVTHDTGGHFVYLLNDCENITVDHVVIKKSRDAIDFMGCRNVQVTGCHFTGCSDDTIGIKSDFVLGRRILSENFYVWDCYFESGCSGLQFGSETAGDFRNIRFWSIKIAKAMKAGIGITSNDSGNIEDVEYRDIEIANAACPIFILITDRLRTGESGVLPGKIKNVTIKNVTISEHKAGKNHGPISTATISGLPGTMIENLTLENIKMTNAGGGTAEDAKAIPPYLKEYSPNQYKTRPAAAFFVRHVKTLTFKNVEMAYEVPDFRSPLVIWDADGVTLDQFISPKPEGVDMMSLKDVRGLNITNSSALKNTKNGTVKEGTL